MTWCIPIPRWQPSSEPSGLTPRVGPEHLKQAHAKQGLWDCNNSHMPAVRRWPKAHCHEPGISSLGSHPCTVCSKGPGKEKVPALPIKRPVWPAATSCAHRDFTTKPPLSSPPPNPTLRTLLTPSVHTSLQTLSASTPPAQLYKYSSHSPPTLLPLPQAHSRASTAWLHSSSTSLARVWAVTTRKPWTARTPPAAEFPS